MIFLNLLKVSTEGFHNGLIRKTYRVVCHEFVVPLSRDAQDTPLSKNADFGVAQAAGYANLSHQVRLLKDIGT